MKDQHPGAPANAAGIARRRALTGADQRPLVAVALGAGATDVRQFTLVNGFAATMSAVEQTRLAADPRVQAVVADTAVRPPMTIAPGPVGPAAERSRRTAAHANPPPGVCPSNPTQPLLQPEALSLTGATAAQQLATGSGVTVGLLGDGVDTGNPDFLRADGSSVFTDNQDFSGEGLNGASPGGEGFGGASAAGAQARQTYDLSTFMNPASPLPAGCTIRIRGIAPGASLVELKVAGASGLATVSSLVQAIDYAVTVAKVNVISDPYGDNPVPDNYNDPQSLALRAAVAAGVTVAEAAGDAGPKGTVGNPAGDPAVISVGAATSFQLIAQLERNLPGFTDGWDSDNVSALSSGGVTENATVDDLMAPGENNWALCSTDVARFTGCLNGRGQPSPIQSFGGTSQAAPYTAGAAALVIQAYRRTHQGSTPSPALVKAILTSTATDQRDPSGLQGAGLLNCLRAVQAALSAPGTSAARTGENLLLGQTQLSATEVPGTVRQSPLTVTNIGAQTQTIFAGVRVLGRSIADQTGSVTLDATTAPTWTSGSGHTFAFVKRSFTVPPGADELAAAIAFPPASGQFVNLRLIDPHGALVSDSAQQGDGGFGHVFVHAPAPGTWTAVFDTTAATGGFNGTVDFEFRFLDNASLGTVTPAALTLAPGQSGTFQVSAATPGQPGDLTAAVVLRPSLGRRVAVPLVLRSLIAIRNGLGTFTGTLRGGDGFGPANVPGPAQISTYRFDVPGGLHDFGVSLSLSGNPHEQVFGFLEDPHGQLLSQQVNVTGFDANGNAVFGPTLQEYRSNPEAGRWTFVVFVFNPVSGAATRQPFVGRIQFNAVDVQAAGLPDSPGTTLPAGQPVTATVTVHNTGAAPESFFADPRSTSYTAQRLIASGPETAVPLPQRGVLNYQVPTETSVLTATASATAPITLDLFSVTLEPEVLAAAPAGATAVAAVHAPEVQPGPWSAVAGLIGPFPPSGAPAATADFAAYAVARSFDAAVTSSTGDQWLASVQPGPPPFTPLMLQPGQTGTITVTITPPGPTGTVSSGVLYVDDFNAFAQTGDELTAIPYTYTTK